ncbi:MAG: hypothetical protein JW969_12250 [Spirochaetales bacterium]|nr:hypothetical protein [Spirochaetales bacterium]
MNKVINNALLFILSLVLIITGIIFITLTSKPVTYEGIRGFGFEQPAYGMLMVIAGIFLFLVIKSIVVKELAAVYTNVKETMFYIASAVLCAVGIVIFLVQANINFLVALITLFLYSYIVFNIFAVLKKEIIYMYFNILYLIVIIVDAVILAPK